MLKSQAVGLLLKLVCIENAERKSEHVDVQQYGVRRLAEQTGISKSQVSLLLNHLLEIGLVRLDRQWHVPRVNRSALLDILRSSVRYLFPVRLG
ncbi:MAG: helix-turn-helix domain-containing protein, partial [Moraxellaceae bacterium]